MSKPLTKKVRIDRKRWLRAGTPGETGLLCRDSDHKKCCLGFACGQLYRITEEKMLGIAMPDEVLPGRNTILTKVESNPNYCYNSKFADECSEINDDDQISDKMREYKLKRKFASQGILLEFYN